MPKNHILPKNKFFVLLYAAFHAIVLLPFLLLLATGAVHIDADFSDMLPQSAEKKAVREANRLLTKQSGRNVFILVSHENFEVAKQTAEKVYDSLGQSRNFDVLSLYSDADTLAEVFEFVHTHKFSLLGTDVTAQLATEEGAQTFAQNALAQAYGLFTLSPLENLDEDPFMLGESVLQDYLTAIQNSGTSMSPKDGVLSTQYEGRWYVMISGMLSSRGAAVTGKENGIAEIYRTCTPLEKNGVRFVYSGTPFHSYKSSSSAAREVTVISTLSLIIVIVILIFVFRSTVPLFASVISILLAIGTGFAATCCIFGGIHMLSLVFATSLIGCCIDYSLHYFIHWKADTRWNSGSDIRAGLFKGLTLSLVSTEICYLCLLFAPFALLKQIAVFSSAGILSVYLAAICIYPLLPLPPRLTRKIPLLEQHPLPQLNKKRWAAAVPCAMLAIDMLLICAFHKNVKVQNTLSKLYTLEGRLKEDSELSYKVLNYAPSSWFIISGSSTEAVLQHEEEIRTKIDRLGDGKSFQYVAASQFIPSIARQEESYKAAGKLLPLADSQYDDLGVEERDEARQLFARAYSQSQGLYVTPDDAIPSQLEYLLSSLWLGNIDGEYYTVLLPSSVPDADAFKKIAEESGFAWFENEVTDISTALDRLTELILLLFAGAFVIVLIVLKCFYTWKQTCKIASVPLLSVLTIVSVFAAAGKTLDFFAIIGMVLVFGLGLDYIIYMMEHKKENALQLEPFAIVLSFLTTALSFGTLAMSTFMPVHLLGLSIFSGLATAFICTLF